MELSPEQADPAPIRILIVEDDQVDRMACRRAFAAVIGRPYQLLEAEDGQAGLALAQSAQPDCLLLDYNLPDLTGLEFLSRLQAQRSRSARGMPVMMLTGADSATVAAEAMRMGARDYVVKDVDGRYLELLPAAIARMLREQRLLDDKQQLEAKFRALVEQIPAITYVAALGAPSRLQYVSPQIRMLGYAPEEWLENPDLQRVCLHPEDRDSAWAAVCASRQQGTPLQQEYRLLARDGRVLWVRDQASVVNAASGALLFMQGILIDISAGKLAEQALRASQTELRSLAAHQERIKEEERARIAREIHDELGGLLTGIKAYIQVAMERGAASGCAPDALLAETAGLAQSAIETVRRVIADLRPSVLDQLGVWSALEWYAEQVSLRTGLQCEFSMAAGLAGLELDQERSTMLFRIAQEALTNVVRHAGATEARLHAGRDGEAVTLTVSDNGKGIDSAGLMDQASWGILGMHERCRRFGGTLSIHGDPGRGTVLALRLPLEADHAG